jgi:hypothetical protein
VSDRAGSKTQSLSLWHRFYCGSFKNTLFPLFDVDALDQQPQGQRYFNRRKQTNLCVRTEQEQPERMHLIWREDGQVTSPTEEQQNNQVSQQIDDLKIANPTNMNTYMALNR